MAHHSREIGLPPDDATALVPAAPVTVRAFASADADRVVAALTTTELADYVDAVDRGRRRITIPLVVLPLVLVPLVDLLPSWAHFFAWGVACVVLTVTSIALMNVPESVGRSFGLPPSEAEILAGLLQQARRSARTSSVFGPSRDAVEAALQARVREASSSSSSSSSPSPSPSS